MAELITFMLFIVTLVVLLRFSQVWLNGVAITMVAGDTFYGKFTKITTDSSAIVVAYAR